jgi:hypothetical protein
MVVLMTLSEEPWIILNIGYTKFVGRLVFGPFGPNRAWKAEKVAVLFRHHLRLDVRTDDRIDLYENLYSS